MESPSRSNGFHFTLRANVIRYPSLFIRIGLLRLSVVATILVALVGWPCLDGWPCLGAHRLEAQGPEVRLASVSASSVSASSVSHPRVSSWPYELLAGQFQIHSTVPLSNLHPLLPKLTVLPKELQTSLNISIADQPVHIVVLEDRATLDSYVKRILPEAPSRRALYIRHRGPGLVLTYFNPAWITDARHECTHAVLDASNVKVPQWLDEGLAEYFETANANLLLHSTHSVAVQSQVRYGQTADLEQLERMPSTAAMSAKDYRDAWSVVAYLLNSSPNSQVALQTYLQDLQNEKAAGFLTHRLKWTVHSWRNDFTQFFRKPAG